MAASPHSGSTVDWIGVVVELLGALIELLVSA